MTESGTLTTGHWSELLAEVREEVGEGKVRGFGFHRRLDLPSDLGTGKLWLGGGSDEGESYVYCVCFTFKSNRPFPATLRLGRRMGAPLLRGAAWTPVATGDGPFDEGFQAWSPRSDRAIRMLTGDFRRAVAELAELDPDVSVYVVKNVATLVLPGLQHNRSRLVTFLLRSAACVQHLLAGAGSSIH